MKKTLIFALSAAMMLCPMTAYAAQSEEAKAVYLEMENNTKAMDSADVYYDINMKMSGSMMDDLSYYTDSSSLDMRLEMNTKMNHMTDPSNLRFLAFMRMSLLGEQVEGTIFYENDWCYVDMAGEKSKQQMSFDELNSSVTQLTSSFNTQLDYMDELSLTTDGENKILNYTINDAKINEYVQTILGTAGMSSLMEGTTISIRNARGSYMINAAGYPTNATMNMDLDMTMYGETLTVSITAAVGYANPGQPVEFATPNTAGFEVMQ